MTYRERRQAKAERLREWAQKREQRASAQLNSNPEMRHDWAFITQPGHIPARARMNAADDRAFASLRKAEGMAARADGIEAQLNRSIYSDDPDAPEALRARIADLEAQRERMKAVNKAIRKSQKARGGAPADTAAAVLADLVEAGILTSAEALSLAKSYAIQPYHGLGHPAYALTNLGANIARNRKRLEQVEQEQKNGPAWHYYHASKYESACLTCGQTIAKGSTIVYRRGTGEAKHFACYEQERQTAVAVQS